MPKDTHYGQEMKIIIKKLEEVRSFYLNSHSFDDLLIKDFQYKDSKKMYNDYQNKFVSWIK